MSANAEAPISAAVHELWNCERQSCRFTCISLTCKTDSPIVTVRVSSKSQVASVNNVLVSKVCKTSLNLTFSKTVTPPFSIVGALKSAAEMYFPAALPA